VAKSEATNYDSRKAAKSEATNYDSGSAPTPKRKRGKGDSSVTNEEVELALEEMDAEKQRPKRQSAAKEYESPMFIVTPVMAKRAKDHADNLIAEKKRKKSQYVSERNEKLKAIGQEKCVEYYEQKIAEVKRIVGEVEQDAVKEAQKMLEKIQGTPEAGASGSVPKSATPESTLEADRSEAPLSAKVTQIRDSTIIISPSSSPQTDSDQDNIPLSQKINILPKPSPKPKSFEPVYPAVLQSIWEMSQRRVDICNKLLTDHPFQPPIIEPLNIISADTHTSASTHSNKSPIRVNPTLVGTGLAEVVMGSTIQKPTRLTPLQKAQPSATAEDPEDPEEPSSSDLTHFGSPSNLFSLEKHLGGEFPDTPQKASKSVPKKIDLVNQQPPKPTQQNDPELTSLQTKTQAQTQEKTILESFIETVVEESVPVTESAPSVSVPDSEPTQNLTLSASDQPSSSSHTQILEQPPINILESEYIEAELLKISEEMQALVQLRRVPTLSIDYEDQWSSLKSKASELTDDVSKKCLRIQAAALRRHLRVLHLAEQAKGPLLYLANAPFYSESEYVSREVKVFKMLKQKVLKQQEESKAREDSLLQR